MKVLIAALLILVLSLETSSFAGMNQEIEESGYDWTIHLTVGSVVSGTTMYYLPDDWKPYQRILVGIAAGLLVGMAIESFDKNYDWQDVSEYGYGAVAGTLFLYTWEF